MSKPLFLYNLYCETCNEQICDHQPKVVIEDLRRMHAQWHANVEREAVEEVTGR